MSETVEASLRVVNRHQFFVWTQGAFQRLLPHEILLCGVEDGSRKGLNICRFHSTSEFRDEHFDALCAPESGLLPHLTRIVEKTRQSIVLCPVEGGDADLGRLVSDNALQNLAVTLVSGPRNSIHAFYGFARLAYPPDVRTAFSLALLVPHLHSTFLRVLANESAVVMSSQHRSGRVVTRREEEILQLIRDGKTNAEIADILSVSPYTVKNHLKMIFRKLNSSTRTHAIARAISLGILRSDTSTML